MASMVTSEIVEDSPQADGRRHVRERHVDSVGAVYRVSYLAEQPDDVEAIAAARAPLLIEQSEQAEIRRNLDNALSDDVPAPTTLYTTSQQTGLALRELWKESIGRDAYRIAWYVNSFGLNDAQLMAFFGLTAGQLPAAKAKLTAFSAEYDAMQLAQGE